MPRPVASRLLSLASLASLLPSAIVVAHPTFPVEGTLHRYDWEVSLFEGAPDGVSTPVYGINGRPAHLSPIEVTIGDEVEVHVTNKLEDDFTCIHWHGLRQFGTQEMDGVSGITHCRIPANVTAVYRFTPDKPGTFWLHGHDGVQYAFGLRAPLIVHQRQDLLQPWERDIDGEYTLMIADWYHDVPVGAPIWDSIVINERGQYNCSVAESNGLNCSEEQPYARIKFQPGSKYRIRVINAGALAPFDVSIDGHEFQVIAADADPLRPSRNVNTVRVNVAQRYDLLVQAREDADAEASFWIRATGLFGAPWTARAANQVPEGFNEKGLAVLQYVGSNDAIGSDTTGPTDSLPTSSDWPVVDMIGEFEYEPLDPVVLPDVADERHVIEFTLGVLPQNPTAFLGYTAVDQGDFRSLEIPGYPTLFSVASGTPTEQLPAGSNAHRIGNNNHVEIAIANLTPDQHPFHLHAHSPRVVGSGNAPRDALFAANASQALDAKLVGAMQHDVFTVPACSTDERGVCTDVGYVVLRYDADNTGVWMLHCHIDWHFDIGLAMLLVENEADLMQLGMGQFESAMINVCNTTGASVL